MDNVQASLESTLNLAQLAGQPVAIAVADSSARCLGSVRSPDVPADLEVAVRACAEQHAVSPHDGLLCRHGSNTAVQMAEVNGTKYVVAVKAADDGVASLCAVRAVELLTGALSPGVPLDGAEFRTALGNFVTGVVVGITKDSEGERPVGMTATALVSLSLDPPLIGLSVATKASSHEAFVKSSEFSISMLHAGQSALALQLARSGPEKFAGVELVETANGWRLAEGRSFLACKTRAAIALGDHTLLVGEVYAAEVLADEPALLFLGGGRFTTPAEELGLAPA